MSLVRCITDGYDVSISNTEKIANEFNTLLLLSNHLHLNKKQNNSENLALEEVPAYIYNSDINDAKHILLPKLKVRVATSHDTAVSNKRPVDMLAFQREWMRKCNIQLGRVSAIGVKGDSMEPGLQEGDTILIDHTRNQVRRGAVVVARVSDDLLVKRLEKTPDDKWILVSGNHEYRPLALTKDDAVISGVVWRGRWLG